MGVWIPRAADVLSASFFLSLPPVSHPFLSLLFSNERDVSLLGKREKSSLFPFMEGIMKKVKVIGGRKMEQFV